MRRQGRRAPASRPTQSRRRPATEEVFAFYFFLLRRPIHFGGRRGAAGFDIFLDFYLRISSAKPIGVNESPCAPGRPWETQKTLF